MVVIQRPLVVIQRPMHFMTNLLFGSFHVILPFGSWADSKSPLSFASSGHPEFAISVEVSTTKVSLPHDRIDVKGVKGEVLTSHKGCHMGQKSSFRSICRYSSYSVLSKKAAAT